MRNKTYIFCTILFVLALQSCKEDPINTYSGENNVFFTLQRWSVASDMGQANPNFSLEMEYDNKIHSYVWSNTSETYDSLVRVMFFYPAEVTRDTIFIPVNIMGFPVDRRRELTYDILPSSTAVEGTHYRVLDAYIPADAAKGAIIVEMYRSAIPDNDVRQVDFRLLPNEDFFTNFEYVHKNRNDESPVSAVEFRLTMTNDAVKPEAWRTQPLYNQNFGYFSKKKLRLILDITGADGKGFYPKTMSDVLTPNEVDAYGGMLAEYLVRQQMLGTPVYEDDGTLMTTDILE